MPQGSLVSPALFNIFFSSLLDKLSAVGQTLGYADDVSQATRNAADIETSLDIIDDWCTQTGMLINKGKSGIFTKNSNRSDIRGIQTLKHYKYLGIELKSTRTLMEYIKKLRLVSYRKAWRIKYMTTNNSLKSTILLVKTLIHPAINYVKKSTKKINEMEALDKIIRQTIRISIGLGNNTKNDVINSLLTTKNAGKLRKGETKHLINNFNRSICKRCNKRISTRHLSEYHGIHIDYNDIINPIVSGKTRQISKTDMLLKRLLE